ncbi:MAG: hypothetical protein ACKOI2_08700, partial [Actinomycetota bacterium]
LRPLWQAGFSLDEFPPEPITADGTIAHAIERSILDIAKSEGFHVVELDTAMPQWRRDWSARRTLPSRSKIEADIERAMARSDLVTVDLFDTLVLRPSLSPSTLQTLAARRAAADRGIAAETLLRCRLNAENAARQTVSGDVDIVDIRAAAPSAMRACVAAMIAAEAALEADMCIPRTWLIDLLRTHRRPGRTILLMSDTYLPRSCIDDLLGRIGADDVFDGVLVSNEVRARKDSGAMWDLVESTYAVPRDRWMHLGDNEHSDVQIPRDRGIDGIHVPSPHGTADYLGIDRRRIDSSRTFGTDFVVGLAATGAFSDGQSWWEDASPARRFGWAGIGPLLWTYITWLIQHSATRDASHMLFIARDGHLPWTALQRLSPFLPSGLPPAHYFLISRRSALSAAQGRGLRPICCSVTTPGWARRVISCAIASASHFLRMSDSTSDSNCPPTSTEQRQCSNHMPSTSSRAEKPICVLSSTTCVTSVSLPKDRSFSPISDIRPRSSAAWRLYSRTHSRACMRRRHQRHARLVVQRMVCSEKASTGLRMTV